MALNNILKEPRRELIETLLGAAIVGGVILADYRFGLWFEAAAGSGGHPRLLWLGMMLGIAGGILLIAVIALAHLIGEAICDSLEDRGIHLRPKNRA